MYPTQKSTGDFNADPLFSLVIELFEVGMKFKSEI